MQSRVPIYSIASWSSIISLKAAMFFDPIRDIYEVGGSPCLHLQTLMTLLGFHDLYILPTFDKLSRGGESLDNYDAWSGARPSLVAPQPLSSQSRYLGPSHLLSYKAWNTSICLVEANTGTCIYNYEGYWDI